ncbi:Pentatricopeptide repeat [Dillenia turbinata]|uniref:Pentatricopeptide repeat n=1 Tax=Dillenia turbinata TaxID=194707 RepID=A0AAN8YVT2_9MAGN
MLQPVAAVATKYQNSTHRAISLLDKCLHIEQINQIQSHLTVSGTLFDPRVSGRIIFFCATSDSISHLSHALNLFLSLPHRTTFIWNTIIRAFAEKNKPFDALSLYKQMLHSGFLPNNYTFSFVLRACNDLSDVGFGLRVHAQIVKLGWESFGFVQNGLIHLYAKCKRIICARKLFDESSNRDVISWTALINGYAKCGDLVVARELFDKIPEKNAISWSAMINGYTQMGMFREALELFNHMLVSGFWPNRAGIVGALTACAFLGALDQGRWIHAYMDRNNMVYDRILGTAVVDMYAKCGCIETACRVFEEMKDRDVFAFTSLISGLANHDKGVRAIELFKRMQKEGVEPNEVTFICVLSACSRMGLVEEGIRIFNDMREHYGLEPGVEHYGCIVDLLGRAGMLVEAKNLVREMPVEPDSYVLGALLNACQAHGDVELGKETLECFIEQRLDHSGVHVLLSNMYASANQWDDVSNIRKGMEVNRVKKVTGCSLIEVDGVVCEFTAGERSHVLMVEMVHLLLGINKQLKSLCFDDENTCMSVDQAYW